VHATALARELGVSEIIVPLSDLASGWSAFGIASADALVVHEQAVDLVYPFDPEELNRGWERLEQHVLSVMAAQGVDRSQLTLERISDIRYTAQVNTLPIPSPDGNYSAVTVDSLVGRFEGEYGRLFGSDSGYSDAGYALSAMRVSARAPRSGVWLQPNGDGASGEEAIKGERGVIFYEQGLDRVTTPVYDGGHLHRGMTVAGPAILEFIDTTVVLRHGQSATIDALRDVRITT
jgi:N-methylhydantoinase A